MPARSDPGSLLWLAATRGDAAVIRALGYDEIDLYGDSYGTYFVQDFAARHPGSTVIKPAQAA